MKKILLLSCMFGPALMKASDSTPAPVTIPPTVFLKTDNPDVENILQRTGDMHRTVLQHIGLLYRTNLELFADCHHAHVGKGKKEEVILAQVKRNIMDISHELSRLKVILCRMVIPTPLNESQVAVALTMPSTAALDEFIKACTQPKKEEKKDNLNAQNKGIS